MLVLLLAACSADAPHGPGGASPSLDPVRIGWQTTWGTQGQLTMVLQRTDILAKHGLAGEFVGFSYGGPLNEGALAGAVDVVFTADQPALVLATRAPAWGVVARLMNNRVGLFVPEASAVTDVSGLRGQTLAVPFGAAAHRHALAAVRAAGLDPATDMKIVNLGIEEIGALASGGWGDVAAAAAWDPLYASLETGGAVKTLAETTVTAVVLMDDAYVAAHPGADVRLRDAVGEAWGYYAAHTAEANAWFRDAGKLTYDDAVLARAASVEPNLVPGAAVRITLDAEDLANLDAARAFLADAKLLADPIAVDRILRPSAR